MYDVIIVGAGVTGCAVARYLSRCQGSFLVLEREETREAILETLFRHTTTLGVRASRCDRYTLSRTARTVDTAHGPVRVKSAEGFGVKREKAEFDDLARIARETGRSLREVRAEI